MIAIIITITIVTLILLPLVLMRLSHHINTMKFGKSFKEVLWFHGTATDTQKTLFRKVLLVIKHKTFSFIGHTLTEFFEKSDNRQQIYKETSSTFYNYAGL